MNAPLHPHLRGRFSAVGPVHRVRKGAHRLLGARLVDAGLLDPGDLAKALSLQQRQAARLGEILTAHDMVPETVLLRALAEQAGLQPLEGPFEIASELRRGISAQDCLLYGFAPIKRLSGGTQIALVDPMQADAIERKLPEYFGKLEFVLVGPEALQRAIASAFPQSLAGRAETLTPPDQSCRTGLTVSQRIGFLGALAILLAAFCLAPTLAAQSLLGLGFLAIITTMALKLACLLAALRHKPKQIGPRDHQLPKFSLLVPLYKEGEIARTLVKRLSKLSYPTELMEILLVLEEDDALTRATLKRTRLPDHMRAITVPDGVLKTKPRALNYALDFTDGHIVGVYDAEDAPAPDQLHRVAQCFAHGGQDLACVQGVLSFYNWSRNWLARCFFFEYAGWFRVMLPGLSRLGFAIPLGGTTLFFRRSALVDLGGWDAHNVTEDADLGIRLARYGYRTEMVTSITEEEANCRVWPWIKQRSRWLKGYAVTWAVHMRRPFALWRALGTRKFLGFQVLFLGTLTSFFLAPAFWVASGLMMSGVLYPSGLGLTNDGVLAVSGVFLLAEALNLSLFWIATRGIAERPSLLWTLTLPAYFVFASVAAYKAFFELWRKPFFWDKTQHGEFGGVLDEEESSNVVEFTRIDLKTDLESNRQMVS